MQFGVRGQGAQKPFGGSAPQVEHPLAVARCAVFEQSADRFVAERGFYGVVGVGDP
ncbi:hypothetical protein Snoj_33430 [Streptomyces nojiriensis]|uniref:Uncharacterized protein n=1 Tax=Streptomyces nojiriensis TaxID=66374 RepID=A0ABQ3SMQ6_9ACTN|nr:hypothetical protein GCM10010205_70340 [Streptomyces nojiriensis]GHI69425.1 hypothetical protein Snoj_33430 [Streptomyces nojiriensis]